MPEDVKRADRLRAQARRAGKKLCMYCDFTGMVIAKNRVTGVEAAFRCVHCDAAKLKGMTDRFPPWGPERLDLFEMRD